MGVHKQRVDICNKTLICWGQVAAAFHLPSCRPTCGQNGYTTPAVLGVPNTWHGDKIRNGYFTPNLSSQGPTCRQSGYITHAILGVPNARHGDKMRNGCFARAVLQAHMWTK